MDQETKLTYIMPDDSMKASAENGSYSINKGDLLIADPRQPIQEHDIVLVEVDQVPTVRMYHHHGDTVVLEHTGGADIIMKDAEAAQRIKLVGRISSRLTQVPHIDKVARPSTVAIHECNAPRPIREDTTGERTQFLLDFANELFTTMVCGDHTEPDSNLLRMHIAAALPTVDLRTLLAMYQAMENTSTADVN